MKYEYGRKYEKYDMTKTFELKGGILKVHNIFDETPSWMKQADVLFCDPPGNAGCFSQYYDKAEVSEKVPYTSFVDRLFEVIDEIGPRVLFIETFRSNHEILSNQIFKRFDEVWRNECHYYHDPTKRCSIIQAGGERLDLNGMDEQDAMMKICSDMDFECIADPLMGQGLTGRSAYLNGKRFVGTELNPKRLAVLVDWLNKQE